MTTPKPMPKPAPKLLIVTTIPNTAAGFLLPFAEHFRRSGWQVDLASSNPGALPELAQSFDQVHDVPFHRGLLSASHVKVIRPIQELVSAQRYDLVHVHTPIAGFLVRLALRRLRQSLPCRVVYTAHGFHFFSGNTRLSARVFQALEHLAARWCDRVVVINQEDYRFGVEHLPVPVCYMPGIGVDTEKWNPQHIPEDARQAVRAEFGLPDDAVMLLMIAEFNPGKRHEDALHALAALPDHCHLVLAGVGPQENAVRQLAERLGLQARVHFAGFRRDIPVLITASRAVVLPSEREGLPRCLLEAMSMGVPFVATRIRGIVDLIEADEPAGLLFDTGDVNGLATQLNTLVVSAEKALALGQAGRRQVSRYDIRHIIELHETLYAELLGSVSS